MSNCELFCENENEGKIPEVHHITKFSSCNNTPCIITLQTKSHLLYALFHNRTVLLPSFKLHETLDLNSFDDKCGLLMLTMK